MSETIRELGAKIRRLRLQKKWSQGDLAKRCLALDRTYISRLERGQVNPTLKTLECLALVLDVPLKQLF